MTPHYRPATMDDARELAPILRDADVREIEAASGFEPLAALQDGVEFSDEVYALIGRQGDVVGLAGVISGAGGTLWAAPWMLASDGLARCAKSLTQQGRPLVRGWLAKYRTSLRNFVWAENTVHIRWLRHLGFTIAATPIPHGVTGAPFYHFWMLNDHV